MEGNAGLTTGPAISELEALSDDARELIVRTIHRAGAGHLGGPLSAIDLLIH